MHSWQGTPYKAKNYKVHLRKHGLQSKPYKHSYRAHHTMHTIQSIPLQSTPYKQKIINYTLQGTPYKAHHTKHTLQRTTYKAHHTKNTLQSTPYKAHLAKHTIQSTPCKFLCLWNKFEVSRLKYPVYNASNFRCFGFRNRIKNSATFIKSHVSSYWK